MSSVLRPIRKRKKSRTLGPVEIIRREDYAELEVDAKVELIRSLVPLGLMHVEELLDAEVTALAGERYARKDASVGGRRHGSNPGTVGLAGQRVPIRVPRIRHVAGSEMPLRSYEALHGERAVNDLLLTRVLYGISSGLMSWLASPLRGCSCGRPSECYASRWSNCDELTKRSSTVRPEHHRSERPTLSFHKSRLASASAGSGSAHETWVRGTTWNCL